MHSTPKQRGRANAAPPWVFLEYLISHLKLIDAFWHILESFNVIGMTSIYQIQSDRSSDSDTGNGGVDEFSSRTLE
jgi:hypothetical protein